MSIKERIKQSLGIEGKAERTEPLKDDTHEVVETDTQQTAAAEPVQDTGKPEDVQQLDAMQAAGKQLDNFELSQGAASLLDRALDALSKNTGAGLEDPAAVQDAKLTASIIRNAGNDLSVVLEAYTLVADPLNLGATIYSVCNKVMRQSLFFANLDYRQAEGLDIASDDSVTEAFFARYVDDQYVTEALGHVVEGVELVDDPREADREPPYGFETHREAQLKALARVYGSEEPTEAVINALSDLRLFLQLLTEVHGWDPERPMPYANNMEPNGTFTPIHDVVQALELTEIKRAASQVRRRERAMATSAAALEKVRALMAAKVSGPKVHRVQK